MENEVTATLLFVDDEPNVLLSLKQMFQHTQPILRSKKASRIKLFNAFFAWIAVSFY